MRKTNYWLNELQTLVCEYITQSEYPKLYGRNNCKCVDIVLPTEDVFPWSRPDGLIHSNMKMEAPVACTLKIKIRIQE